MVAGAIFAFAAVAAAPFVLDSPPVRRLVAAKVNLLLAATFAGHITVERIGLLGVTRVGQVDVRVESADGKPVLRVEGGGARVSTWDLIHSAMTGRAEIVVDIRELSLSRVEATLDPDDSGALRIARAFELRPDAAHRDSQGRGVRLMLRRVVLAEAKVSVEPHAAPPFEVDVRGAEATLVLSGGTVAFDVDRAPLVVRGLPGGVQAQGALEAHVTLPPLHARGVWNGVVGAIGHRAEVIYGDGRVDAVIDVAAATAEQLHAVWPDCPISTSTAGHAEAHGILPRVEVSAHAAIGQATLDVRGPVVVQPDVRAELHFDERGFDARSILGSGPRSNLSTTGDVVFSARPSGSVTGRATVDLAAGTWAGVRVPSAGFAGQFERSAAGEVSALADVTIREPGAPAVVSVRLTPRAGTIVAEFDGDVGIARLENVEAFGGRASGSGHARASGAIDFGAGTVDARLSATVANLAARGVALHSARVEAHAKGHLRAPSVDLTVEGEGLERAPWHLSALRAQGRMTVDDGIAIHDARLDFTGDGEPGRARADLVRFAGSAFRVDGGAVDGLGAAIRFSLATSSEAAAIKVESDGVDLARLGDFESGPAVRGKLSLDVDAAVGGGSAHGHVALELDHAAFSGVSDASAQLEATIDGRRGSGAATARFEDIGTVSVRSSSLVVGSGPLLSSSPWRKSWGTVDFEGRVDLARLASRLPLASAGLDTLRGALELRGRVSRDSGDDATPGVELAARTSGLVISGRRPSNTAVSTGPGTDVAAPLRPWQIAGIDPVLHATVDGNTGSTALQAQVGDATGTIVTIDAQSDAVPYATLFSDESPEHALRAMTFDARIAVPARRVESLPAQWRFGTIGGLLTADARWHGSVLAPTIDATAGLVGGRPFAGAVTVPFDFTASAHYDGSRGDVTFRATSRGRQVLDANAAVQARARDVLAGLSGLAIPWTASARANLDRLPLRSIAWLDDGQVRGNVTGRLSLDALHSDARAAATLDFLGLEVAGVPCKSSRIEVTTDGHVLDASARLDQKDGFFDGRARLGVHWGSSPAPSIDSSQPAQVKVSAKGFRAALLGPLLSKWVSELDGRVDADVAIEARGAGAAGVQTQGTIALRDGTFELASFGGEFHGASANVTMSPDGVVRLEDAFARGVSGSVGVAASARLDGLSIAAARASVRIPAKDPLPLLFDGIQMGVLDGDFEVTVNRDGASQGLGIVVDVPAGHVALPSSASSLDVQSLGEVEDVQVGLQGQGGHFVEVPLDGARAAAEDRLSAPRAPTQIAVHLRDLRVSRGTDLDVRLEGTPSVIMANETKVSGQIRMPRGSIDILGKRFAIDHGTVTFVGADASNPQILLSASWIAPDATRIYADFVGPLKTGKVTLRSEPAKGQSEILMVLLGAGDQNSGTSMAAAAGGGAATQPLNRALGGVDRALENLGLAGGITTKIDTSQSSPRPEVEVQIARDISMQIAWVLGAPPPGTNPDSALVTLNWHFLRKWSLETTVGDMGTSIVDLVWQHRY